MLSLNTVSIAKGLESASHFAYVNPTDYKYFQCAEPKIIKNSNNKYVNIRSSSSINRGDIALNQLSRTYLDLTLDSCDKYSANNSFINVIDKVCVSIESFASNVPIAINVELLKNELITKYNNNVFFENEILPHTINGYTYKIIFNELTLFNGANEKFGLLTQITEFDFAKKGDNIRLEGNTAQKQIFNKSFDFKELEIGGLNDELTTIFRKVFVSRLLPTNVIEKLGLKHIKGLILHGPPGTGKTLIARQLSKTLKAKSIKIINGPEIISSFVGKSEENVRELFKEAEKDMKNHDDGLHVIIFDEFDSLCKKRGASSGVSGDVNDKIVTQLLSKIDGVDSLNNILLIGMTNRIDLIDPAILRAGRFEVHIEISLPDEKGRFEILNIHTKTLRENKCLDNDVDITDIAKHTKNYTGAELEGVVRDARSYAINELVDLKNLGKKIEIKDILITQNHFNRAVSEYVPKFGSEVNIDYYIPNGIDDFDDDFVEMKNDLLGVIKDFTNNTKQLYSILITGDKGKTAFSVFLAKETNYPFIKVITNNDMIGFSENDKIFHIKNIFEQAYVSDISVIVIDSVETIVEYYRDSCSGSLRFMSSLYNALKTLIKKIPIKQKHKLLLIINYNDMDDFNDIVNVHKVINYIG